MLMTKDDSVLGHQWSSFDVDRSAGSEAGLTSPEKPTEGQADRLAPQPSFRSKGNRGLTRLRSFNPFKKGADFGFNPEELAAQKREWSKHFSDTAKVVDWPPHIFEAFFVAGLPHSRDTAPILASLLTGAKSAKGKHNKAHGAVSEDSGVPVEGLPPQILFSFPSERAPPAEVANMCFPHGVHPHVLQRTPSMTALNQFFCGQQYSHADTHSFIFFSKVADNLPLYGVCCYMEEAVHRPPAMLGAASRQMLPPLGKHLLAAPRCYCLLTHYPFFSLHFKVLHMVMGLEHMQSTNDFLSEIAGLGPAVPASVFGGGARSQAPTPAPADAMAGGPPSHPGSAPAPGLAGGPAPGPADEPRPRSPLSSSGRTKLKEEGTAAGRVPIDAVATQLEGRDAGGGPPVPRLPLGLRRPNDSFGAVLPRGPDAAGTDADGDGGGLGPAVEAARAGSLNAPVPARRTHHRRSLSASEGVGPSMGSQTDLVSPRAPNSARLGSEIGSTKSNLLSRASRRMQAALASQPCGRGGGPALPQTLADRLAAEDSRALSDSGASSDSEGTSFYTAASGVELPQPGAAMNPNSTSYQSLAGFEGVQAPDTLSPLGQGTSQSQSVPRGMRSTSMRTSQGKSGGAPNPTDSNAPANALQVLERYHGLPVPQQGEELEFLPDAGLQPMHYLRPLPPPAQERLRRTAVDAAESEAADALAIWTVAALAGVLSLENILLVLTCVLLERQLVVFCPSIGILSMAVLATIPLLRPFAWQSLMLPILPDNESMLHLLDAPVPFVIGIQYKTPDMAARCNSLVRVNVYKDQVNNVGRIPQLPGASKLLAALAPSYWRLNSARTKAKGQPIYATPGSQLDAVQEFLQILQEHLRGICTNIHNHTITDVQTNERVSVLMKESFIGSFVPKDRDFIKEFVETQMFTVYSDCILK